MNKFSIIATVPHPPKEISDMVDTSYEATVRVITELLTDNPRESAKFELFSVRANFTTGNPSEVSDVENTLMTNLLKHGTFVNDEIKDMLANEADGDKHWKCIHLNSGQGDMALFIFQESGYRLFYSGAFIFYGFILNIVNKETMCDYLENSSKCINEHTLYPNCGKLFDNFTLFKWFESPVAALHARLYNIYLGHVICSGEKDIEEIFIAWRSFIYNMVPYLEYMYTPEDGAKFNYGFVEGVIKQIAYFASWKERLEQNPPERVPSKGQLTKLYKHFEQELMSAIDLYRQQKHALFVKGIPTAPQTPEQQLKRYADVFNRVQ